MIRPFIPNRKVKCHAEQLGFIGDTNRFCQVLRTKNCDLCVEDADGGPTVSSCLIFVSFGLQSEMPLCIMEGDFWWKGLESYLILRQTLRE